MNTNNLDMEQLRKAWVEMGKALGMEEQPADPYNLNNLKTSLDRLRSRYMRGTIISIFGALIFSILIYFMPPLSDEYRFSVAISYAILMLANAYVLYWFWQVTGKIDPITMPISQVSSLAKYYKKCHLCYHFLGILATIPWIAYFFYALIRSGFIDMYVFITAAIIGGICGLRGLRIYLNDYRDLAK